MVFRIADDVIVASHERADHAEVRLKTGSECDGGFLAYEAGKFSLEFKMKDEGDQDEVDQAAKYAPYLQVVLGPQFQVAPALVLTRAADLYDHVSATGGVQVAVVSPDLLFNVFDERLGFFG
jgi:hypothetical protein